MEKKKQTYTPEQKERKKARNAIYLASRSPEKVEEDKAKRKISQAKSLANRSDEKVAEDKAKRKIANAEWMANRSPEKVAADRIHRANQLAKRTPEKIAKDKAKAIITSANFRKENPEYSKERINKSDLGYYCVYLIENYNGTGDAYCGQTGNLYNRMSKHRSAGRLNTENHRILGCFRTREQALAFEAIQHKSGYHGDYSRTEINK